MLIRLSLPGSPDRVLPLSQFASEYEIEQDELRDMAETLNNGLQWDNVYRGEFCSLVRINRKEQVAS